MRPLFILLLLLLALGCTAPGSPKSLAEQGREIAQVFESAEPYTARTIDSTAILRYL